MIEFSDFMTIINKIIYYIYHHHNRKHPIYTRVYMIIFGDYSPYLIYHNIYGYFIDKLILIRKDSLDITTKIRKITKNGCYEHNYYKLIEEVTY